VIGSLRRVPRRAARGVALAFRTPSDGWLVVRMFAWRAVLPALKRLVSLRRLVDLVDARPAGERRPDRERRIVKLAERTFDSSRLDDNCLDRSLVTYRYLAAAGAEPRLVIAYPERGGPTHGHAWVTVDDVPVHDSPHTLRGFTSLVTFESGNHGHPSEMNARPKAKG
jgi:hypothetical protein